MQCEYTTPAVTEPRKIAPRLTPFSSRAGKRRNARLRMSGRYRCHHTAPWRARLPDMFSGFIISARRPAGSAPQRRTNFGLRHGFAHRKMSCVCTPRLLLHQLFSQHRNVIHFARQTMFITCVIGLPHCKLSSWRRPVRDLPRLAKGAHTRKLAGPTWSNRLETCGGCCAEACRNNDMWSTAATGGSMLAIKRGVFQCTISRKLLQPSVNVYSGFQHGAQ